MNERVTKARKACRRAQVRMVKIYGMLSLGKKKREIIEREREERENMWENDFLCMD